MPRKAQKAKAKAKATAAAATERKPHAIESQTTSTDESVQQQFDEFDPSATTDDDCLLEDDEKALAAVSRTFPHRLEANYTEWTDEQRLEMIDAIVIELRRHCAREGTSPGDETSLYVPTSGRSCVRHGTDAKSWFAGSNAVTAFFLDSFLYSQHDVHDLIDCGELDLFHCTVCERTMQGDSRPKTDTERQADEAARRKLIQGITQRYHDERQRESTTAPIDESASVGTAGSLNAPAASLLASTVEKITNIFSHLMTTDCDHSDESTAGDVDPPLAAKIAALPALTPYRFPRYNARPKHCRLCRAPGSDIAVRTHLTHSLSVAQMTDMYRELIRPHIDFAQPIGKGKQRGKITSAASVDPSVYAVDIGSRLGNMLYMGLLHTWCPRWVGVELDSFFVRESRRIVRKWQMTEHIRILEDDIAHQADLLRRAKLVCFFNSFELHVTREKHRELLQFLADSISQANQYLLSCPSLSEIYTRAESDVNVSAWVELIAQKDDAFLYRVR